MNRGHDWEPKLMTSATSGDVPTATQPYMAVSDLVYPAMRLQERLTPAHTGL